MTSWLAHISKAKMRVLISERVESHFTIYGYQNCPQSRTKAHELTNHIQILAL